MSKPAIMFELLTISVLGYLLAILLLCWTVILPEGVHDFIGIMIGKMWFMPLIFWQLLCIPAVYLPPRPRR